MTNYVAGATVNFLQAIVFLLVLYYIWHKTPSEFALKYRKALKIIIGLCLLEAVIMLCWNIYKSSSEHSKGDSNLTY